MKNLLYVFILALSTQLFAEDKPRSVIRLYGEKEEINFLSVKVDEGVEFNYYDKTIKNKLIVRGMDVPKKQWQSLSFSFKASKNGKVRFMITGRHSENSGKLNWVEYDDVKIQGASIFNGDFELVKRSGHLENWWNVDASQVIEKDSAKGEKHVIAAGNQKWIQQWMEVKAGLTVKVTFKYRAAKRDNIKLANKALSL